MYAVKTMYPAVVCTIPFGRPVDPEVYKIKSGSSASITSAWLVASASSIRGCIHSSRPSFIEISCPVRFTTSTFSIDGVFTNASSAIRFRSMTFVPRNPPSAVISSLHEESLMRLDSAWDEKPPNTTEWIAPMRAQAKTAKANSGIMGK